MTATDTPWMVVAEVIAYAKSSRTEVQAALADGSLRGHQITPGGKWRVHRDDADAWLRREQPAPTNPKFTRRAS